MNISQTHVQHHQRNISGNRCVPNDTLVQKSSQTNRRRITKEKLSKGDREEVWPPDVESAFMKALEVLPKLGRRKVLVNGKPCGRNELIADFIYKQTNKVRDRKQVSSHIQVLKNTRKNEVAFMKLLTDCGDGEDDIPFETVPSGCLSASHSPVPSPHLRNGRLENAPTGDASMRPSGTTVVGSIPALAQDFDNSLSLATDTESLSLGYQFSQHHYGGGTMTASRIDTNHPFNTSTQSLYQQSVTTPDSAVSLSSEIGPRDHVVFEQTNRTVFPGHPKSSAPVNWPRDTSKDTGASRTVDSFYPLWPTAFRLCMQYLRVDPIGKECLDSREHDGIARDIYDFNVGSGSAQRDCSAIGVHELARATDLRHHALGTINIHQLHPEKFPTLYDLYERATCAFLFLRVLESSEVQQATLDSGRFVHKFEFVNQFFKAFLTGIRMLATPDEVDVALSNLSLLQVYEDLDTRVEGTSPLLVMAFDFERGRGTVAPYRIVDDADVLESLESVLI
ncbi:hypothetical protein BGX31_000227 [Mortierella sp. GBA43]|nr:hypothetical protein BGX31_000227 [Mortierella sp. GBA43]